jgi:hypothetical protein
MKTRIAALLVLTALPLAACKKEVVVEQERIAPAPGAQTQNQPQPKPAETAKAPDAPAVSVKVETEAVETGSQPGERLPSFTAAANSWKDGQVVQTTYDHAKTPGVRVYVINRTTCPASKAYAERMVQIEQAYAPKGVTFLHLYPQGAETPEDKREYHKARGFTSAWVVDDGGKVTTLLECEKTPEYVVVGANGVVSYRGGIDDSKTKWKNAKQQWLTDALDATLAGREPPEAKTEAAG